MASTYYAQILRWDWPTIVKRSRSAAYHRREHCTELCDDDGHEGRALLGTVESLAPSGKFYGPGDTHQTADDVERDSAWYAALDRTATKFGGLIDCGEEDRVADLIFARYWTNAQLS